MIKDEDIKESDLEELDNICEECKEEDKSVGLMSRRKV